MYREQWESGIIFIKRLRALIMWDPWSSHTGVLEDSSTLKWYVVSTGNAFIFRVKQAARFCTPRRCRKWGWRSLGLPPLTDYYPYSAVEHCGLRHLARIEDYHVVITVILVNRMAEPLEGGGYTEICWRGEPKHCGGAVVGIGPKDIFPWSQCRCYSYHVFVYVRNIHGYDRPSCFIAGLHPQGSP